ncbi:MAG: hypothetical protein MI975_06910 [Cytophagales bacterium]|nr:hypothetical protein [Cytophagales bacterium]
MSRSQNIELVQRINHAFTLLGKGFSSVEVLDALINQYGVSKVQAYRYIQTAKKNQDLIPIPEPSVVFTIKLAPSLIKRIRATASSMGLSISTVVKMALEEFLSKPARGEKRETS